MPIIKRGILKSFFGPDALSFPHAPCPELCNRKGSLRRFHFSCLTCPTRRVVFGKHGSNKYQRFPNNKPVIIVLEPASGRQFIMPKHYQIYGLIIPTDMRGYTHPIKSVLLKYLMTLAERIAEW